MFSPYNLTVETFVEQTLSLYIATATMSSGTVVDLDTTDTTGITNQVGFTTMYAGAVKPATIAPASNTAPNFGREFGIAIPTVNLTGPSLQERILQLASSVMVIPVGYTLAIFRPKPGDIIVTTSFVGANPATDSSATGYLDVTNVANSGAPLGIFQGKFRKVQSTDEVRARYLFNTQLSGVAAAAIEFR
jgi:hypothetical protein